MSESTLRDTLIGESVTFFENCEHPDKKQDYTGADTDGARVYVCAECGYERTIDFGFENEHE